MNFRDDADQARFRAALRAWLAENAPRSAYEAHGDEGNAFHVEWHRKLYLGGWLGVSWPKEYGGQGLAPLYQAIVQQEVGVAGAPPLPDLGFLGRAILAFGTKDQCERYLRPMLSGELQWCQGFSEPGAGSDLASLTTRAELDGDDYRVNGQKVWTSRAQWADWCLLLCRTNPTLPKHQGLSCLVFEMDRPGITVQPLRQIWGAADFNEVFLNDLRVPVSNRIGEEGDGWAIATTVLAHERGPADIGSIAKFERQLGEFDTMLAGLEGDEKDQPARLIADAYIAVEACRLHGLKSLSLRAKGVPPGAEASVDKLLMTRAEQKLGTTLLAIRGADALLATASSEELMYRYLRSRAGSISGGTEQIQRTIIAQRLLKMGRTK